MTQASGWATKHGLTSQPSPKNRVRRQRDGEYRRVILLLWASLLLAAVTHAGPREDQLVQAATDGDVPAVNVLLRKAINWNDRAEPFGKSILHRTIEDLDTRRRLGDLTDSELDQLQRRQTESLRLLIKKGAKLEARDNNGATPLIDAAGSGGNVTQSSAQVAVVKLLLDLGAHVNSVDNNKCSALHMAALRGYVESVKLLLDHGADPSLKNVHGESAKDMAEPGQEHLQLDAKRRAETIALLTKRRK